jgi:hypothetical protein
MNTVTPTLEQLNAYISELSSHDWYYTYSDDGSVYRAGERKEQALRAKAKEHPVYQKAWNIWSGWVFAGDASKVDAKGQRDKMLEALRSEAGKT